MTNLKYRLLLIAGLVVASVWTLWPRTVIERVKRDGVFVFDTVDRVPLKKGLDLQGGMYLALEVDESKGAVANKERCARSRSQGRSDAHRRVRRLRTGGAEGR